MYLWLPGRQLCQQLCQHLPSSFWKLLLKDMASGGAASVPACYGTLVTATRVRSSPTESNKVLQSDIRELRAPRPHHWENA